MKKKVENKITIEFKSDGFIVNGEVDIPLHIYITTLLSLIREACNKKGHDFQKTIKEFVKEMTKGGITIKDGGKNEK